MALREFILILFVLFIAVVLLYGGTSSAIVPAIAGVGVMSVQPSGIRSRSSTAAATPALIPNALPADQSILRQPGGPREGSRPKNISWGTTQSERVYNKKTGRPKDKIIAFPAPTD